MQFSSNQNVYYKVHSQIVDILIWMSGLSESLQTPFIYIQLAGFWTEKPKRASAFRTTTTPGSFIRSQFQSKSGRLLRKPTIYCSPSFRRSRCIAVVNQPYKNSLFLTLCQPLVRFCPGYFAIIDRFIGQWFIWRLQITRAAQTACLRWIIDYQSSRIGIAFPLRRAIELSN